MLTNVFGKSSRGVREAGQKKVVFLEVEDTSWRSSLSVQLNLCVLPQGRKIELLGEGAEHL